MASLYILYSQSLDKYYVGSCEDVESRIKDHLSKHFPGAYTARANDWELFFKLDDLSYSQARRIEIHIKRMKSKVYIQNLGKYPNLAEGLKKRFG